jgi:hypothetical protein
MTDIADAGANFIRDLREAARENPISAALIGMGVLWMFGAGEAVRKAGTAIGSSGRRSQAGRQTAKMVQPSAMSAADQAMSGIGSAARTMADRAASAVDSASEFGRKQAGSLASTSISAAQTVGDAAASALDNVSQFGRNQAGAIAEHAKSMPDVGESIPDAAGLYQSVRSNLSELFETQPLALGAIGLAVGAGIAAALPVSEMESSYFGEASDALKRRASDLASEQASRAKDVAKDATEAALEESSRAGFGR